MKKLHKIFAPAALAALLFAAILWAEDGDKNRDVRARQGDRPHLTDHERPAGERIVEGRVRIERRIEVDRRGEADPDRPQVQTFLQYRRPEGPLRDVDRRPEGDRSPFVRPEGPVRDVDRRPEGDRRPFVRPDQPNREGPGRLAEQLGRMAREFREIAMHFQRMEREIQALRTENERLKRILREKGIPQDDRQRPEARRREGDQPREQRERQLRGDQPDRVRREGDQPREQRERQLRSDQPEREQRKENEERTRDNEREGAEARRERQR